MPMTSTLEHDWFLGLVSKAKKKAESVSVSGNGKLLQDHDHA